MPNVDGVAKAWQMELAGRVGKALHDYRRYLNLSAQALASRTAELGYPLTRVAISKIESNSRAGKLDVSELVVLAEAMGVPPVALLYPRLPDGDVEFLPGQHVASIVALLRFTGERDNDPQSDLGLLAKLSREKFDKQIRIETALELLEELTSNNPGGIAVEDIAAVADNNEELKALNRQIRAIPESEVADRG
ncbi:XRE family transcriptional regulator [Mycobacteroides abscessus]|uniref:XRE family transcriptional regulator n=1 Tax=Mycobacteroides abscessus TaxID=36809 RepID=A0ABD7HGP6_9MYCO|nr:helix-turn-helix transcriptional regulator [Mycobacteroides abscessus]RIT28917.1 XRE family transcriptional regulator [Mycobacteroides abscessus]